MWEKSDKACELGFMNSKRIWVILLSNNVSCVISCQNLTIKKKQKKTQRFTFKTYHSDVKMCKFYSFIQKIVFKMIKVSYLSIISKFIEWIIMNFVKFVITETDSW